MEIVDAVVDQFAVHVQGEADHGHLFLASGQQYLGLIDLADIALAGDPHLHRHRQRFLVFVVQMDVDDVFARVG